MSTKYFQDLESTGAWDSAGTGQWTSDLAGLNVVADPVNGDDCILVAACYTSGPAVPITLASFNDGGTFMFDTSNLTLASGGVLTLSYINNIWAGHCVDTGTATFSGGSINSADLSGFTVTFTGMGSYNANTGNAGDGAAYLDGAIDTGVTGNNAHYDAALAAGLSVGTGAHMTNGAEARGDIFGAGAVCDSSCAIGITIPPTVTDLTVNVLPGYSASFTCNVNGPVTINYATPVAGKLANYNGLGANYYSPASAQAPKANEVTTTAGPAHNGVVFDGTVTGTAIAGRSWGRPRS